MWWHPYWIRTVRGAEDIGEWFTEPVSFLAVRLPLILSSQSPSLPWTSVLSQLPPLNLPCHAVKYMEKNIHYYNNVFRFGVANKIAYVTNLRSLKWSYSCSIICVGSFSSCPIFWDAKTSAVKGHAPYSPTAATLAAQSSSTNKITTGNCSLITNVIWPSPGNAMCYLNLKCDSGRLTASVVVSVTANLFI